MPSNVCERRTFNRYTVRENLKNLLKSAEILPEIVRVLKPIYKIAAEMMSTLTSFESRALHIILVEIAAAAGQVR